MNIYKRDRSLPPLILDKDVLLKIEKEVTKPWEELKKSTTESLKKKFAEHNREVTSKGYSYKVSTDTDISKKLFPVEEIETESKNENRIAEELKYPLRSPKITYIDSNKELEVPDINTLYDHNLEYRFNKLEIIVYGKDSKTIDLSFSSSSGFLNSIPGQNKLKVSSSDEAWSMGTIERVYEMLRKNESPRAYLNNPIIKVFFLLVFPILTVYVFSKLFYFATYFIRMEKDFSSWLTILIYFIIFFGSFKIYDDLFSDLIPGAVLDDEISTKLRSVNFMGLTLILGVLGTLIWEVIRNILLRLGVLKL